MLTDSKEEGCSVRWRMNGLRRNEDARGTGSWPVLAREKPINAPVRHAAAVQKRAD